MDAKLPEATRDLLNWLCRYDCRLLSTVSSTPKENLKGAGTLIVQHFLRIV